MIRSGKNPLEVDFFFFKQHSISEVNDLSGDVKNGQCKFAKRFMLHLLFNKDT